jgi:flagellar protein FlgJ
MLRPDLPLAPTPATAPLAPARPLDAAGGGRGFGALFAQVQTDVGDFIAQGSGPGALESLAAFAPAGVPAAAAAGNGGAIAAAGAPGVAADADGFLAAIAPYAEEAGARLGVAPELVAAHAALESGWGRKPLRAADGTDTHNLFGIKAGGAWQGAAATAATTEVAQGVAVATTAAFRRYPDTATAFRDYAQLLAQDPRYRGAIGAGSDAHAFAAGLARGGYASDPAYADKLARVAAQVQARTRE